MLCDAWWPSASCPKNKAASDTVTQNNNISENAVMLVDGYNSYAISTLALIPPSHKMGFSLKARGSL